MTEPTDDLRRSMAKAIMISPGRNWLDFADAAIAAYRQHPDGAAKDRERLAEQEAERWSGALRTISENAEARQKAEAERDAAYRFIESLVHMQSSGGWTRAMIRESAADFLRDAGHTRTMPAKDTTPDFVGRVKADRRSHWIAGRDAGAEVADLWATEDQRSHGNGGPKAAIRALTPPEDIQ